MKRPTINLQKKKNQTKYIRKHGLFKHMKS